MVNLWSSEGPEFLNDLGTVARACFETGFGSGGLSTERTQQLCLDLQHLTRRAV